MSYEYTYLLMGLLFGIFWLIFFFWRKETRKEMLVSSILFAFAGPASDVVYTQDWWHPITVTGHIIGPESFLVGFMIGGIAAVAYEDIFGKYVRVRKEASLRKIQGEMSLFKILLFSTVLFFGSFYIFDLNSLYATLLATILPTLIIWFNRKDLVINSLVSGLLLFIIASIVYSLLELITPGWVEVFWSFENTPALMFFNVPLDDVLWYIASGMLIGPLYEFWKEAKVY